MTSPVRIRFVQPSQRSERVFDQTRITIGRSAQSDLKFDGPEANYVSAFHAELSVEAQAVYIADVGSQNGTFVNGTPVAGRMRLDPADLVQFGRLGPTIQVFFVSAPLEIDPVIARDSTELSTAEIADSAALMPAKLADSAALMPAERAEDSTSQAEEKRAIGEQTLYRVVDAAVQRERSRTARAVLATVGLCIVLFCLVFLVSLTRNGSPSDDAARAPTAAAVNASELAAVTRSPWPDIVDQAAPSIFLCFGNDPATGTRALGTAFALSERGVLATNAHVVHLLAKLPARIAVQNQTGKIFPIRRMLEHPAYATAGAPDVGLIDIERGESEIKPMRLADETDLRALRIGTPLGTLGFPAELEWSYLANVDRTHDVAKGLLATFKEGFIGRIVNYRGENADFADSLRIQHSASLSGGTSGSPMFTADGKVVAINHAGLDHAVLTHEADKAAGAVERILNPAQIGHAIRIDVVVHFWQKSGW